MDKASFAMEACVKASKGTAFAPVEDVVAFAVVPAVIPPFCEEGPAVRETGVIAEAGGLRALDEGVYWTAVVRALDPADADAEEEYEFTAPPPPPHWTSRPVRKGRPDHRDAAATAARSRGLDGTGSAACKAC